MNKFHLIAVSLICCLGVIAFSNSLHNEFVHDDNFQIVRNPYLHSDQPISRVLFSDVWGYQSPGRGGISNYYRPLQMLTYRWIIQFVGLDPFVFHLVSLTFHLLAAIMVYLLLWKLTGAYGISLATCLLFTLHPIHTEAVSWIAGLTELGCAVFYFLSLWLFFQWYDLQNFSGERIRSVRYKNVANFISLKTFLMIGSALFFGVALLWKEMAVTLPLIIFCYVIVVPRELSELRARLLHGIIVLLPYLATFSAYLALRYYVLGFLSKSQQVWSLSIWEQFLNLVHLMAMYWFKLLLPINLTAFYIFQPLHSSMDPRFWLAAAFLLLIIGSGFYWLRKFSLIGFAYAWIFITLLPVLHIRGVGINVFTERYLYIPSFGFCFLLVWLTNRALSFLTAKTRRRVGTATLVLLIFLYGYQTILRNQDWENDFIFYLRAAQSSPRSSSMQNSLAHILRVEKGDLKAAEKHSKLALELARQQDSFDPRQVAMAYLNLSNIYIQQGKYEQALQMSRKGLAADDSQPNMKIVHAVALIQLGEIDEAHPLLLEINQLLPNNELTLQFLGIIALRQQRLKEAISYFKKALKILPDYPDAHNNLAATYRAMGSFNDALIHFQKMVDLKPSDPLGHTNLAIALSDLGRIDEAYLHIRRALELSPNFLPAKSVLKKLERTIKRK